MLVCTDLEAIDQISRLGVTIAPIFSVRRRTRRMREAVFFCSCRGWLYPPQLEEGDELIPFVQMCKHREGEFVRTHPGG
jgi:hypothetical protein